MGHRLRHALRVLDYKTITVAAGFLVIALVGFVIYTGAQATHDANVAANQRGKAATRRIDLLNKQIAQLQREIAQGKDERGQLAASLVALAEQIRQLGGVPVIVTISARPTTAASTPTSVQPSTPQAPASPKPRPSATKAPHPKPTHTPCGPVHTLTHTC